MISGQQMKILAFPYTDKYQTIICDGAVRSGKTSIMTIAFVDWAMREFNGCAFGICGKTTTSAIRNIVKPYMSLSYSKKYDINLTRSDNKLIASHGYKTNIFYIYGGKDESSYTLIQGITLAGVLFDEVALMPQSFVDQALARCISFPNRKYWFNCNPESENHWFYKEWICQPEKHEALHLHFLMSDNPIMTQNEIDKTANMWSGIFYKRYVLGQWVTADGAIYQIFSENNKKFLIEREETLTRKYSKIYIGVDWGNGGKSRNVYTAVGIVGYFEEVVILKSMAWNSEKVTPIELEQSMIEFVKEVEKNFGYVCGIFCDQPLTFINGCREALKKSGMYNTITMVFKRKIIDRIIVTLKLFGTNRLKINNECKNIIEAFNTAVWDKTKENTRLDNGTSDIDSLDSFEYAICVCLNVVANAADGGLPVKGKGSTKEVIEIGDI